MRESRTAIIQGIPDSTHSPDATNGGSESFTDNIFVQGGPSNREFSYVICFYHDASATFTGVSRTGQSQTLPVSGNDGDRINLTITGGPPVPSTFTCP